MGSGGDFSSAFTAEGFGALETDCVRCLPALWLDFDGELVETAAEARVSDSSSSSSAESWLSVHPARAPPLHLLRWKDCRRRMRVHRPLQPVSS